uniref:Uncharacterized protein n=1 Tax=Arundo donax TaxID=35708 RepID=A0A0A9C9M2_ARUDO
MKSSIVFHQPVNDAIIDDSI